MKDSILRRLRGPSALAAIASGLALAVYLNALRNGFALDDTWIVRDNRRVHLLADGLSLRDLRDIWLTPYWPSSGQMLGLYRPLTIFGFGLQWWAGGGEPWLFHLVNLALHAGATVLVFYLTRRLVRHDTAAFLGAALFAVHPVHTEVVANVVGQSELVAALSLVGALLLHVRWPSDSAGRSADSSGILPPSGVWRDAVIALVYLIGMLAKEHAIVLPAVILVIDGSGALTRQRAKGVADVLSRAPAYFFRYRRRYAYVGLAAFSYLVVRIAVLGSIGGTDAAPQLPYLRGDLRLLSAFRAWPEYARLLFFPLDLSADYSPGVVLPVERLQGLALLGLFMLLAVVAVALLTPWRAALGLPAAWFLLTVLPTSNLVIPAGVLLAERTLYVPSIALAFLTAWAWRLLARDGDDRRRILGTAVAATVLPLLAVRTLERNPDWASTDSVVSALIRDHPEAYRAQWNAATRAFARGDTGESAYHFELAYRIWPEDAQFLTDYAGFKVASGQPEDAIRLLKRALELMPDIARGRGNLAVAHLKAGQFREALEVTDSLLPFYGPHPQLLELRARALTGMRSAAAPGAWRAAFRNGVDGWRERALYARALAAVGDTPAAVAALDSARARARVLSDTTAVRGLARERESLLSAAAGSSGTNPQDSADHPR